MLFAVVCDNRGAGSCNCPPFAALRDTLAAGFAGCDCAGDVMQPVRSTRVWRSLIRRVADLRAPITCVPRDDKSCFKLLILIWLLIHAIVHQQQFTCWPSAGEQVRASLQSSLSVTFARFP